jgi:hypothetical protein
VSVGAERGVAGPITGADSRHSPVLVRGGKLYFADIYGSRFFFQASTAGRIGMRSCDSNIGFRRWHKR